MNARNAVQVIILLLLFVMVGWYFSDTYTLVRKPFSLAAVDFPAYYEAGRAILEGRPSDLYLKLSKEFTNLPVISLFLTPLSMFEYNTAWHILWWSSVITFITTLLLLVRSVHTQTTSPERNAFLSALIFLAYAPLMHRSLFLGQTTPLAVLLLAICVFLLLRGRNIGAGVALGALCSLKIPPLLILGVFAARRRWTTVAAAVTFLTLIVSASWLGFGTLAMRQYTERVIGVNIGNIIAPSNNTSHNSQMIPPAMSSPLKGVAAYNNQSLDGMWMRTFSNAGLTNWEPAPRTPAATIALYLSLAMICIGVLWAGWRFFTSTPAKGIRKKATDTVELEVSLGAALMVLVLPVTWTHYFLFLSVPFALLPIWWRRNNLPYSHIATVVILVGILLTAWPHVGDYSYYSAHETHWWVRLILAGRTIGALLLLGLCLTGMKLWSKAQTKQDGGASDRETVG